MQPRAASSATASSSSMASGDAQPGGTTVSRIPCPGAERGGPDAPRRAGGARWPSAGRDPAWGPGTARPNRGSRLEPLVRGL